jgi:predicted ATPase
MVSLKTFGIDEGGGSHETVALLVGPNGSGKSTLLLDVAWRYRLRRNITIVCNTPHDRFAGLRGPKRISVGSSHHSPKLVVKRAVAGALNRGSEFYQISSILEHCGYRPRFGFRIDRAARYGVSLDELAEEEELPPQARFRDPFGGPAGAAELSRALEFLQRWNPDETIWIDATGSVLEFSLAREFASVLANERLLRKWRAIKDVSVYLEREDGEQIEIRHASSGQLALISSLLFMVTNAGDRSPLIIIDEPENSLHPNWQREYVEKVLAAMSYRNATLIVATHAPLIVTGALADSPDVVSVYEVRNREPTRLDLNATDGPNSIEEILWRAFDVVTPANHFVSEQIVAAISRFEKKEIEKLEVLGLVDRLDGESFDDQQKRFFRSVRQLVDKVEVARDRRSTEDPDDPGVDDV